MTDEATTAAQDGPLTRQWISDAVHDSGWRFVLGSLCTAVHVGSIHQATQVAALATQACGDAADESLAIDVRHDRAVLVLQSRSAATVTRDDVALAHRVTEALSSAGLTTGPMRSGTGDRSVQVLEIAVDAMDIASVRPFWKAALGYVDEPGRSGPEDPLVDPLRQGPAVWFQQMDEPRPQRNRIHVDVSVPHDEAKQRIRSALAAGGVLVSDAAVPSFWVLADAEGNELCITTWQGRD